MDANKNVQHTTTVETHERDTMAFQNIFLDVQIPSYGLTFSTDLVDVLWFLRFQFTLKLRSELEALEKKRARAPKSQEVPSNESLKVIYVSCNIHWITMHRASGFLIETFTILLIFQCP